MKMDKEVVQLVEAMNLFRGIRTVESCCGHGERPIWVFFEAEKLQDLPELLFFFDRCHSGVTGWRVIVKTDCSMAPAVFVAEGPVGDYEGADQIARHMKAYAYDRVGFLQVQD